MAPLAFLSVGEHLKRGEAFGSLEAAKFVGPLTSPLSGPVSAINEAVVADPSLVERDPYGAGWLVEMDTRRRRRARRAGLRRATRSASGSQPRSRTTG